MPKLSAHLSSAMILANSASEMLADAALELKDAGDPKCFQELRDMAGEISSYVEKLRLRRDALVASELVSDNDRRA